VSTLIQEAGGEKITRGPAGAANILFPKNGIRARVYHQAIVVEAVRQALMQFCLGFA